MLYLQFYCSLFIESKLSWWLLLFFCLNGVSHRVKPVQKSQGITNGTSGGAGQQQASALCDISAQVQQYQQFLGEEHLHIAHVVYSLFVKQSRKWMDMTLFQIIMNQHSAVPVICALPCVEASKPLPDFVEIDLQDRTLPDGILLEHLKAFQTLYREHCEVRGTFSKYPCLFLLCFFKSTKT